MESERAMVAVGAGEAGAAAVTALREGGWTGPLILIGSEDSLPYERPPLSKSFLVEEPLLGPRHILTSDRLRELRVTTFFGRSALSIDRSRQTVKISDGATVPYERLLLATGAAPRTLPPRYGTAQNVFTLRTHDDAVRLRGAIVPDSKIVVIGGGFIGLEVAASAVSRGALCVVLEAGPRLLTRAVPEALARLIQDRHEGAGVQIVTSASITRIEERAEQTRIILDDGRVFYADIVVVGIGAVPNVKLAEAAGLSVDNGIVVDETLATSDPNIFAAGDCCSFPHPLYERRLRLEAWRNARSQAGTAAANMLGAHQVHDDIPWFWSDQYEETLQIAGICPDHPAVHRDLGPKGTVLFYLDHDSKLVAACGFGSLGVIAKEIRVSETLIAGRLKLSPAALADPTMNLKSLLVS
ncbi:MAG: ferredoxin reductase [Mesorhizobium sp.]|uniref:NAD(P)/FAD-dependent oxidoreductase n=1 Tax=Mesorhizobium sp. TaxID=1871066 RepID=UPI000FE480E4|nr:FAD-dependent oxidoreductase [Mesorhizobium sp.]RWE19616.1 MAG: ferredoxin reductase [Mesorhizobium sp.]